MLIVIYYWNEFTMIYYTLLVNYYSLLQFTMILLGFYYDSKILYYVLLASKVNFTITLLYFTRDLLYFTIVKIRKIV